MAGQQRLSIQLYEALEEVGASETIRRLHQRLAAELEVLTSFRSMASLHMTVSFPFSYHICGSKYEGSVTPSQASDIDFISCFDIHGYPIVLDPACIPYCTTLLMVRDAWAFAGYVKLQFVWHGRPLTELDVIQPAIPSIYDVMGRLCLYNVIPEQYGHIQGPAVMGHTSNGDHVIDTVFAFKCNSIPDFAKKWLNYQRPHGWPTPQQLEAMNRMGCMVVQVGHWESHERNLEWRISFSLQERLLMSGLNPTQHKVYILIKMIKKDILGKIIKRESLSSYHCKTCILHAVHDTPAYFWCPDNLIGCLLYCLRLLLHWVNESYCPNYFIPDQNLFSKENFVHTRDQIKTVLELLIKREHRFVYMLDSDCIARWMGGGHRKAIRAVTDWRKWQYLLDLKIPIILWRIDTCLRLITNFNDSLSLLGHFLSQNVLICYTNAQTIKSMRQLLPWIHLSAAKYIAARAIEINIQENAKIVMNMADEHFLRAARTDVTSVRFAKASILYAYGKYGECEALLQKIENDLTFRVLSFCGCQNKHVYNCNSVQQFDDLSEYISQLSIREIVQHHIASCVVFFRSESRITPVALQYEMYRSLDTELGSRNEVIDHWFDCAVVDARVFLYFMKYLVFSKLQKNIHKQIAVDNINSTIEQCNERTARIGETFLGHKDTAYNLLGWIYLQENRPIDARYCFTESMKIRTDHNAAKFHLRDMG